MLISMVQVKQLWGVARERMLHEDMMSTVKKQQETYMSQAERAREWEQEHGKMHRELNKTYHTHKPVKEEATPVERPS